MEIISINIVQMELIIRLKTMETTAGVGLVPLGIVISSTRGVSWTDVEIKTNILEITIQHGYFIKWPCEVSDAGPHCMYFILGYRCVFKKEVSLQTQFHRWDRNSIIWWGRMIWLVKLTTHHQKETWLHWVHFVLWCCKLHHNVSLQCWHKKYVTVYELTCFRVASFQCQYILYLSIFNPNAGKYGPEKTPCLDTFHGVILFLFMSLLTAPIVKNSDI